MLVSKSVTLDCHACFERLFAAAALPGVLTDRVSCITYCNESFLRLTDWSFEQIRGRLWQDVLVSRLESEICSLSGQQRTIRWNNISLRDELGMPVGIAAIGEDVTERRTLERALLHCSARERGKLERDLHDGLGQELVGVALLARSLATRAQRDHLNVVDDLMYLSTIANSAIESCRRIARGVSPLSDIQGGLIHAIRQLTIMPEHWHGPALAFEVAQSAPLALSEEASDHFYRLAEEGLTNALKHSQAQSIKVVMNIEPTSVTLEILDDGVGFAGTRSAPAPGGFGLQIMRHRASLLHAELRIEPRTQRGTRLALMCAQTA